MFCAVDVSGEYAREICIQCERRDIVCKGAYRLRSVCADTGEFPEFFGLSRKYSSKLVHDDHRSPQEISRSRVVAEPAIVLKKCVIISTGESPDIRKSIENATVVRHHTLRLRLLEEDLREPHAIPPIAVVESCERTPRQTVSRMFGVPGEERIERKIIIHPRGSAGPQVRRHGVFFGYFRRGRRRAHV